MVRSTKQLNLHIGELLAQTEIRSQNALIYHKRKDATASRTFNGYRCRGSGNSGSLVSGNLSLMHRDSITLYKGY